jgi:glyoxylase-like metal-dependent hydrolase (beta-lactamase superfamily II)
MGFICKEARILFSGDGVIERVWLHLPESASVQRYYSSVRELDRRKQEFDQIYTGHKNAHKTIKFLEELTGLLELVLEEKNGIPIDTGTASGLLSGKTGCQIIAPQFKKKNFRT